VINTLNHFITEQIAAAEPLNHSHRTTGTK